MIARGVRRHIGRGWFHTTFCVLLLAGCGTEPPAERPVSSIHEPQGTSLLVQVLDTSNKPVPSALVTALGDSMRPTDGAGYILYENLVPGRFSARVEQWGYTPASVVVDLPDGAHGGTFVRLIPLPPRIAFDAAAGAALDQGPVHVTIPSNAIIDANGEPFTGMAEATIVPLDPTTDLVNVPGPLQGLDANGQIVGLQSFYMAEVTLWNGAQKLQLAPGKMATIEMVLPDSIAANVQLGQSIPAWYFDLDAGIWREEGAGTVDASIAEPGKMAWTTQVGHFTWWNCDAPWTENHCYNVRLLDADGNGVPNLPIGASGSGWNSSTKLSSKPGGYACIDVKKGADGLIFVGNESMPIASVAIQGSNAPAAACGYPGTTCFERSIVISDNAVCESGTYKDCPYSGPPATEGVGNCMAGKNLCNVTGTAWESCVGEVLPQPETCTSQGDEDCDGVMNESGDGCACNAGEETPCYRGPVGTVANGICHAGKRTCNGNGFFGECAGDQLPMPETCDTPNVDDNCDGTTDCKGITQWSKGFGDAEKQEGQAVAVDGAGNVVLAGYFGGTVDFGGGPLTSAGGYDICLAKFDSNGNHVWSRRFGDIKEFQIPEAVAIDNTGNVVFAGYFDGTVDFGGGPLTGAFDIFLTKLDSNGNHLWSRRFGDADYQYARDVAIDGAGNVVITGDFRGAVDFGNGPLNSAGDWDVFVLKLDPNGNFLWAKRFGDATHQNANAVAIDAAGNVVFTGNFGGTVDLGGGSFTNAGDNDAFVAKLNPNGGHLWSRRFGEANNSTGSLEPIDCGIDSAGNVVLTGTFGGTVNFGDGPLHNPNSNDANTFVAKLDSNGSNLWSRGFGGNWSVWASAGAIDSADNVVITGTFGGSVDFGGGPLAANSLDVFVAKLDSDGSPVWSKQFGDASDQYGNHTATDNFGNVFMTGHFDGAFDANTGPALLGYGDIFLAKLTP